MKIIWSDNKINHIKSKIWYHDTEIIFKPYTLNIYTQNARIERFGRLIIKKVWAMRLLANLLYKL